MKLSIIFVLLSISLMGLTACDDGKGAESASDTSAADTSAADTAIDLADSSADLTDTSAADTSAADTAIDLADSSADLTETSADLANDTGETDTLDPSPLDPEWANWPMPHPAGQNPALPNPASYDVSRSGIVLDEITGLEWQRSLDSSTYDWEGAKSYCADLPLDGGGWRLPSVIELVSLVDTSKTSFGGLEPPTIDEVAFPETPPEAFWSSSPAADDPNTPWGVLFCCGGETGFANSISQLARVRCVRSGPIGPDVDRYTTPAEGTVRDRWTGLTWQAVPSESTLGNPSSAASHCSSLQLDGGGWHLPTIKELQTVVDRRQANPCVDSDVFSLAETTSPAIFWSSSTTSGANGMKARGVYFDRGNTFSIDTQWGGYGLPWCMRRDGERTDPIVIPPAGCDPTAVACLNEQVVDSPFFDTASLYTILSSPSGDGFSAFVPMGDAGSGHPFVYGRFTDQGLEALPLDDLTAMQSQRWHIAFRDHVIRLNSGVSGPSCVLGAELPPGTDFDTLTSAPTDLVFEAESYYSSQCALTPDSSGLGTPDTLTAGYWTNPGCLRMTGAVYVVQLDDGRQLKLTVDGIYPTPTQNECQETGTISSPIPPNQLIFRWAFLQP